MCMRIQDQLITLTFKNIFATYCLIVSTSQIPAQGRSNSKSMRGAQFIQHLHRILKNIALDLINGQIKLN